MEIILKVYHIVMLMMTTLALLFILAPFYRKREQAKAQKERKYYDLLKSNEANLNQLIELAKDVYGNLPNDKIELKINEDRKAMGY